jgi:F-type H+-transporting ATPase subunit a
MEAESFDPHFNWLKFIPGVTHENVHVVTSLAVSLGLILFAVIAYFELRKAGPEAKPASTFSVRAVAEVMTEFMVGLIDMALGPEFRYLVPLFGSMFFIIFFNNILGVFPGMTPATDNYNTTLAIGIFSFIVYNYLGIKENGIVKYAKHFLGPVWWLAPLMLVIELISHLVRPLSLGFRLMGNMQGDHAVTGAFLGMAPLIVPIPFYALAIFVCFIQAFVFTLLSMVYVSMATAHEH